MSELAVIEKAEVVPSLDELAATINAEHAAVGSAALSAVEHAITAGQLLSRARDASRRGEWMKWCSDHLDFTYTTANVYIRMAAYQEIVGDAPGVVAAKRILAGLPETRMYGGWSDQRWTEEAERLHGSGWSVANMRQRRAESADKMGGGFSQAFKQIRASQQTLSNLTETGETAEYRQAATLAYRAVCRAEDEIAKILSLA